jgi:hypothetical protein
MNLLGVYLYPDLLDESVRELERQRQRERQIKEARAVRRAERPSRFAALTTRLRRPLQPDPRRPLVDTC